MPDLDKLPMGECFELESSIDGRSQYARVTEIAASLRRLEVDGIALIQDYPSDARPPFCAGWVLVPWPNRVADGRWNYAGVTQQLDITEPGGNNALHGLLAYTPYRTTARTRSSVTLAADVVPQHGYPFELETSVHYQLVEDGLVATHILKNVGTRDAPVAVGAHPFLRLGTVPTEDLKLFIAADTHIEMDHRLIPTGATTSVGETPNDFRSGRTVGTVALDDAWADVHRGLDGRSAHYLEAPDGSQVRLHMDDAFGYIQAFTTQRFPADNGMVTAVAVEPMTAPPDAFNNGQGLRWLAPGEIWQLTWSINYRRPSSGTNP
ncbi:aldose epimerase [Pseudarthrobacter psychrotolerans]|uniref:Aldose epimerase n=1 Tax=Pseudarthrobacter psychrotolerans TaxID=2697569 RepID=A0A6P1NJU1_9MICC|nr:aldose 1-epimerase family protein [Pseudarthrobacter psychrotolerans]QHK20626.1 aldose epimerase [Pseudarthrobacter psychrotolerans]